MRHVVVCVALLTACSSGTGSVSISTWGENYIEQKIPSTTFADGWELKYSKFLIAIGHIHIADDGEVGGEFLGTKLFDMTQPGKKSIVSFSHLPAKTWPLFRYDIVIATADTELGVATNADKTIMTSGGYSIYVEGAATRGSVTKTFKWGFATQTRFNSCKGQVGGKETAGAVVTTGGTDTIELTIHGDHLYYDDLQAPQAKVRFENMALADTDNDNVITLAELVSVKLVDIPPDRGAYGVGSSNGINDLGAFVTGLSRTIGHFRGEGECVSEKL